MRIPLKTQPAQPPQTNPQERTQSTIVEGQDSGRKVSLLIKQFEDHVATQTPKSKGPTTTSKSQVAAESRVVSQQPPSKLKTIVSISKGPQIEPKNAQKQSASTYSYEDFVQKFGSKTANLYEIENLGVKVPERTPISSQDVFKHLLASDKDNVISTSWDAMKKSGQVDDVHLKAITDKIEEIFDQHGFPFTPEQVKWINETMVGKVLIARSTGDEDSADTPNAGGNESVLFVEPNIKSVTDAMKKVVLSYFGADSLRNRISGESTKRSYLACRKCRSC